MIVVFLLCSMPGIERFIHYNYSHSIAEIEQLGRRRVMARANRVDAHLFQDFDLSLQSSNVERRPERSKIVMIANALEPNVFAVEKDPFVWVELDRANAEDGLVTIHHFPALLDSRDGYVKIGVLQTPQLRIVDAHQDAAGIACACRNSNSLWL